MLSANMRGGLCMMGAMTCFTFNDTIIKLMSASLPLPQIIYLRGFVTLGLIAFLYFCIKLPFRLDLIKSPIIWWRGFADLGATYALLTALKYIPIGNAFAIFSALPLVVTLGGSIFFGKKVGWRRWVAILIGLFGVLLIVRPGLEGFSIYSLLVLACVFFSATRDLITHQASEEIPTSLFVLSGTVVITFISLGYPLSGAAFTPMDLYDGLGIIATGGLIFSAYYLVVAAMRQGEISFVAPFRYTNLVGATIIGLVVFHDPLDWITILGSVIVVSTGLYTLYREQSVQKKRQNESDNDVIKQSKNPPSS